MKKHLLLLVMTTVFLPRLVCLLSAADGNDEQMLIAVLQSGASLTEKDAACARLKIIGTARCVPALAALLVDEQLSHSARYALEPMQTPEAGQALLDALGKTKGLLQVGLINSLGSRTETRAVPGLSKLLQESDGTVAAAAARALSQIGDGAAVEALRNAAKVPTEAIHTAAMDGLLRCANRSLSANDLATARTLFQQVYDGDKTEWLQLAAYRGLIRAAGNDGLKLMTKAIEGAPGPSQMAALQLVNELKVPNATEELARLIPKVQSHIQIALIDGLSQRGDPAAAPFLVALASQVAEEVRVPIINALASLGDASVVPLLAQFAATGPGPQQKAARQALVDLRRGKVTETLVAQMETAAPAVQSELARALGNRGDKGAVPKLLELAKRGPDSASKAALEALALLVDDSQLGSLIQLVAEAKNATTRSEAADAVNSACQRFQAGHARVNLGALVEGLENGSAETRIALLPVCSGLSEPEIRTALRAALKDSNTAVHEASVRALCDSSDAELLEDLVHLAGSTREETFRTLAISGAVRLASQEEGSKVSTAQKLVALKVLLTAAQRPEQKRMVLAGLGATPDPEALKLIEPMLEEGGVQTEAARAAANVALMLPGKEARAGTSVLKKALATTTDEATHKAVEAALQQVETRAEYLTDWQVAGPYRQAGKDYAALFDFVFAPESQAPQGVTWQRLPVSADPKRPWIMDLLKALGGEQCVAYARTWIHCDQDQKTLLELGSDDGVKVWINDKEVYAVNASRALQPGSDKVKLPLRSGWNSLMLKITQNNQGWEFCARLVKPDGSHLEGIECDGSPQITSR